MISSDFWESWKHQLPEVTKWSSIYVYARTCSISLSIYDFFFFIISPNTTNFGFSAFKIKKCVKHPSAQIYDGLPDRMKWAIPYWILSFESRSNSNFLFPNYRGETRKGLKQYDCWTSWIKTVLAHIISSL